MRMISPASRNTGMATTDVMPSAHAAFSSPNFRTLSQPASVRAGFFQNGAEHRSPDPQKGMPFKVLPMPSFTEPMMWTEAYRPSGDATVPIILVTIITNNIPLNIQIHIPSSSNHLIPPFLIPILHSNHLNYQNNQHPLLPPLFPKSKK